jgi:alkylation response protein AidB-like acyl-CoA dehydrogenase
MDFSLKSDQRMLSDAAARYLQQEYDYPRCSAIARDGGVSAKVWQDFADFGWLGAALPEEAGGYGGGPEETAILMEKFGRHVVLEPYLWTAVVGATLLHRGLKSDHCAELLARLVGGDLQLALAAHENDVGGDFARISTMARAHARGWTLQGRKAVVPNGGVADIFLVTAKLANGIGVFLVPAGTPGVRVRRYSCNDGHNAAELMLEGVEVERGHVLCDGGDAQELLSLAADHGSAALCAEVVGSTAYLVETTCEYLKTREQFGAPLARFQVLQHRLADMYVAVELLRSMSHVATAALAKPAAARMREVSAARLHAIRTARLVGREAVQMHGGMGMSEELDVSAHFTRLMMTTQLLGDEPYHLARLASLSE